MPIFTAKNDFILQNMRGQGRGAEKKHMRVYIIRKGKASFEKIEGKRRQMQQ